MQVEVEQGADAIVNLQIGNRGEPLTKPVYLPGYVSWEHELGHHDPLTDVFVLGLILASLTCGLNLNDPEDLAAFVPAPPQPVRAQPAAASGARQGHRADDGAQPPPPAAGLRRAPARTLENYRDQDVDFEFDLARMPGFQNADRGGRRALILSALAATALRDFAPQSSAALSAPRRRRSI